MTQTDARPLRVIGYCRVSTDKQSNGHGLGAQIAALEHFCAQHGHELLTVTTDVVSGTASDRMYGRAVAIAAIESGVADALLVRALDRATRDQEDAAKLFKRAERLRLAAHGLRQGRQRRPEPATPRGHTHRRRSRGTPQDQRAHAGGTSQGAAAGQAPGPATSTSTPPWRSGSCACSTRDGLSANKIAQRLTERGVPTPRGGAKWYPTTVSDVLKRANRKGTAA